MNILFLGVLEDKPYLYALKQAINAEGLGHKCVVNFEIADTLTEVAMKARSRQCTHVITTQQKLIPKLCSTASSKEQTIDNYAGSVLWDEKHDIEYLIVHPLKQVMTKSYGQFLLDRYVSKFTKQSKWRF